MIPGICSRIQTRPFGNLSENGTNLSKETRINWLLYCFWILRISCFVKKTWNKTNGSRIVFWKDFLLFWVELSVFWKMRNYHKHFIHVSESILILFAIIALCQTNKVWGTMNCKSSKLNNELVVSATYKWSVKKKSSFEERQPGYDENWMNFEAVVGFWNEIVNSFHILFIVM